VNIGHAESLSAGEIGRVDSSLSPYQTTPDERVRVPRTARLGQERMSGFSSSVDAEKHKLSKVLMVFVINIAGRRCQPRNVSWRALTSRQVAGELDRP